MLVLRIKGTEYYNEETNEFFESKDTVLKLEHSLLSISRWEAIWKKPWIGNKLTPQKTIEEWKSYILCMCISSNIDPKFLDGLTQEDFNKIQRYVGETRSATTFTKDQNKKQSNEIITSELIYCWMAQLQIPFEPTEKWHLSRLLTLINVCSLKQQPPKKMDHKTAMNQQRAMNQARRAKYHSKG